MVAAPMPWLGKTALVLAAVLLLFVSYRGLNLYDEGIILAGSLRVMNGEVPYRDFWAMYPPGNFYLNALLFSIFGEQAILNRLLDVFTKLAIVLVSYAIIRTWLSVKRSLFFSVVLFAFLLVIGTPGFPVFQATLLALAMVKILMGMAETDTGSDASRRYFILIFLAGALNGLMVAFRHDLAAYALLSVLLWLVYPLFRSAGHLPRPWLPIEAVGWFSLGVATTFVPLAIDLFVNAGYADLYFSLIESPARIYSDYRALPFPRLILSRLLAASGEGLVYFPFAILALSVIVYISSVFRVDPADRSAVALGHGLHAAPLGLLLFSLASLFSIKGLVRPSALHFAPAIILGLILAAYLTRRQSWKRFVPMAVLLLVFFAPSTLSAVKKTVRNLPQFMAACQHPANPRLVCVNADQDTLDAARFIATQFPEAARLFVGTGAHDRIHVGNVAAYFIVPRRPATKWHESHPGIQTRADIQGAIIAELRSAESLVVLVDRRWDGVREPNRSAESSGNTGLDRFLAESFRLVEEFGSIAVYTRGPSAPSAADSRPTSPTSKAR